VKNWMAGTVGWTFGFMALMFYWTLAEAATPGYQYSLPFLPCAFLACYTAWIVVLANALIVDIWHVRRGRRVRRTARIRGPPNFWTPSRWAAGPGS